MTDRMDQKLNQTMPCGDDEGEVFPMEVDAKDISDNAEIAETEASREETSREETNEEETDWEETDAGYDQASLFDSSDEELTAAIEAILFAMGDSVEIDAIAKALEVRPTRVRRGISLLKERCDDPSSGIMIHLFDTAVQMSTKPEQYDNLIKIAKVPKKARLSDAVMETLSVIAYRQPVTRLEIEDVRGVSCDYAINRLLEYDLICEVGRRDVPGRPILFGTTQQFLRSFGLKDLSELPSVDAASEETLREEAEAEVDKRLGI